MITNTMNNKKSETQTDVRLTQSERIKNNNIKIDRTIRRQNEKEKIMNNELTKLNIQIEEAEDKHQKKEAERREKLKKLFSPSIREGSKEEIKQNISKANKAYISAEKDEIQASKELSKLKRSRYELTKQIGHPKSALRLRNKLINLNPSSNEKQIANINYKILVANRRDQLSLQAQIEESNIKLNTINGEIKDLEKNSKIADKNKLNELKENKEFLIDEIESLHIAINNKNDAIKMNDSITQLRLEEKPENSKETKIQISILEKKIIMNEMKNELRLNLASQLEIDNKITLNENPEHLNKYKDKYRDLSNNIIYFHNNLDKLEKEIIESELELDKCKKTANAKDNSQIKLNNEKLSSIETIANQHKPEPSENIRSAMVALAHSDRVNGYGIGLRVNSTSMAAGSMFLSPME